MVTSLLKLEGTINPSNRVRARRELFKPAKKKAKALHLLWRDSRNPFTLNWRPASYLMTGSSNHHAILAMVVLWIM